MQFLLLNFSIKTMSFHKCIIYRLQTSVCVCVYSMYLLTRLSRRYSRVPGLSSPILAGPEKTELVLRMNKARNRTKIFKIKLRFEFKPKE